MRAVWTTINKAKAARLWSAYDDLEDRIRELAEREELAAMRPDLDGRRIMELLQIPPGPLVGRAYNYLLELRIEEGPLGPERAEAELRRWWAEHQQDAGAGGGSARRGSGLSSQGLRAGVQVESAGDHRE